MAYAQINYGQNLGTGPSVSTIADVGCFLTAFCNLLERFGETIDPPTLNNYFISHGTYLPDGPNRDNLGWGSISAYNGNISSNGTGGAGWPPSNDAIVKFIYKSPRSGKNITHFCLVVDRNAGTILDSYDGKVKHTPYGNPVGWATYVIHKPQPVAPPPAPTAESFTVEGIPKKKIEFTKNTFLWDLNQRSWPGMVNNPANSITSGSVIETSRIAHHVLGGRYYMPEGVDSFGYNVVDCKDYEVPKAPEPIKITAPPAGPLQPGGNPDNKYTIIKVVPGFMTATNAGQHTNQVNEVKPGEYFVFNVHPNNSDLINVTSKLGVPGSWINKKDNVDTPPPAPEPVKEEPKVEPVVIEPTPVPVEVDWKTTFKQFDKPVHYIATRDMTVEDVSGQANGMPLLRYNPEIGPPQGVVSAFGTFTHNNIEYYRLKTNNDPEFKLWYGVPKIDGVTGTANLLVQPSAGKPIAKTTIARDTLQLAKTRVSEADFADFLDDIIPKFLRKNKNKK